MTTTTLALTPGYWSTLGHGIGAILAYAVLGLALILIGFQAIDSSTPGPLRKMIGTGNPNAVIIAGAGVFSMALIVVVAIWASSGRLTEGLISTAVYGLVGIIAQVVAMRLLERALGLDIGRLLKAHQHEPQSSIVAAAHISIGLIVAVSII